MDQSISLFKFGGASLRDAGSVKNVSNILASYKDKKIVVVVSAIGKTTNQLEEVVHAYYHKTGKAFEKLEAVRQNHLSVMNVLFDKDDDVYALVNDILVEIEWVIEENPKDHYDYVYDQIVSTGELLSSRIVCAWLNKCGLTAHFIDARDIIRTDDTWREGRVQWQQTIEKTNQLVRPLLEQRGMAITQGFIGGTPDNNTTTLGREGSDFTTAILSFCLDAEGMYIWKDVPGILTGDPRLFENVTKIDRLSYMEAIEMTYYGAKVIHPKTIKPLQNKNIPLYVKSFINPTEAGTVISSFPDLNYPPVVVVEKDQALLQISTRDFSFVAEHHIARLFNLFSEYRIKVNMMRNTAISFSVCINDVRDRVEALIATLTDEFDVVIEYGLELITIRHYFEQMLESFKNGKIALFEEKQHNTAQMVLKEVPVMKRKDV